jgi:murein DD-endopeptidase MepM/ murein hydrolase activator NlpD
MKRTVQTIWTLILVAAFLLAAPTSGHAAQASGFCARGTNNYCLNFSSLPSTQGWTYFQGGSIPEASVFSVTGTSLIQDTIGTGFAGGVNPNYAMFNVVDGTKPFVLTVRARILAYEGTAPNGFAFTVRTANPNQIYDIGFTPSRVADLSGNGVSIDTTAFHTYVLRAIPGGIYTLDIDGHFAFSGPFSTRGGALNAVQFGDDNSTGANAQAEVTRLEFWQGDPMIIPTTGDLTQAFLEPGVSKPLRTPYYDQLDQVQPPPPLTPPLHSGVDISAHQPRCAQTAQVVAAAAGTVVAAGLAHSGGTKVIIDHGTSLSPSGKFVFTEYFHMCKIQVKPGQHVNVGQILGYQSNVGARGVHLHWDIRVSESEIAPSASGWANVPYASPDFYTCAPLTYGDNPPPPDNLIHVALGKNYCWI